MTIAATTRNLFTIILTAGIVAGFSAMIPDAEAAILTHSDSAQLRDDFGDGNFDGTGDGLGNNDFLIPGYFEPQEVNMNTGWSFQMTGAGSGSNIASADFSVSVLSLAGTPDFNLDLHVIRIAASDGFVISDYETSAQLIMADFWQVGDGTGSFSLDTAGQSALTSYLQSNWSENDYIFFSLQTDPMPVQPTINGVTRWVSFGGQDTTDAQLEFTLVPEPSTFALAALGLLTLGLTGRRRRKR